MQLPPPLSDEYSFKPNVVQSQLNAQKLYMGKMGQYYNGVNQK